MLMGIGVAVVLMFPILVLIIRSPKVATLLPMLSRVSKNNDASHSYSAQSDVPEYKITLADSQFLDFVASDINIFSQNAIIDPQFYAGRRDIKTRYTISNVKFMLVNEVENPIGVIVVGGGKIPYAVVGQGNYQMG